MVIRAENEIAPADVVEIPTLSFLIEIHIIV
jgi:hypothetical protein